MLETFIAALPPLLSLFIFIAIGFTLAKTKILPKHSEVVLAKLLTLVFCGALNFSVMSKNFSITKLTYYAETFIIGTIIVLLSMAIALIIVPLFIKDKNEYARKVYTYALTFGNYGYVGVPIVLALFGESVLVFYNVFTIPATVLIYTWGINLLVPDTHRKGGFLEALKKFFNAPTICLFLGMISGLTGFGEILFNSSSLSFIGETITTLADCMAPTAMLVAGITVAKYDIPSMLLNKKVYVATFLRLIVLPAILTAITYFALRILSGMGLYLNHSILYMVIFGYATPLGMNTIVFPEAFGGDASIGASMTLISHVLCVITIPIMYALLFEILGFPPTF